MKYQGICVVWILALAACTGDGGNGTESADLVLLGGKIVTVDASMPEAQALAARGPQSRGPLLQNHAASLMR